MRYLNIIMISAFLASCGGGGGGTGIVAQPSEMPDEMAGLPMMEMEPLIVGRHSIQLPGIFTIENNWNGYGIASWDLRAQYNQSWPSKQDGPLIWKGVIIGGHYHRTVAELEIDDTYFKGDIEITVNDNIDTVTVRATNFESDFFDRDHSLVWQDIGLSGDYFLWQDGGLGVANHTLSGRFLGPNHEGAAGTIRDWQKGIEDSIFGASRQQYEQEEAP